MQIQHIDKFSSQASFSINSDRIGNDVINQEAILGMVHH
jgi:hypothetical protein